MLASMKIEQIAEDVGGIIPNLLCRITALMHMSLM
jgi:hypothetical protein